MRILATEVPPSVVVQWKQGRFWIVHLQKACCGRRCKLWSKDGRGSTVSGEVKSSFMISACAASVVSICIKICQKNFQLSFVFSYCIRPWQILTSEVWVHTTNIKNFCISSWKFWHQRQHELRSLIKISLHRNQCFLCHLLTRVYNVFHNKLSGGGVSKIYLVICESG